MYSGFMVRPDEARLLSFFIRDGDLYFRQYKENSWQRPEILLQGVRERFSVSADEGGVFLFCQRKNGDMLYLRENSGYKPWVIISAKDGLAEPDMLFSSISGSGAYTLVYNLSDFEGKAQYLATQRLGQDGVWSRPEKHDQMQSAAYFHLQNIENGHGLLFFHKKGIENIYGYREATALKMGEFVPVYQSQYPISDISALTSTDTVHCCFIVKSMFSSQLVYRRKTESGFKGAIIWEAQRIELCLLNIIRNAVYVSFLINGWLYSCISYDGGDSFSRPQKYKGGLSSALTKCGYISGVPMDEGRFFCRELLVDKNSNSHVQFLTDYYADFYPSHVKVNLTPASAAFTLGLKEAPAPPETPREHIQKPAAAMTDEDFFNSDFVFTKPGGAAPDEEAQKKPAAFASKPGEEESFYTTEIAKLHETIRQLEDLNRRQSESAAEWKSRYEAALTQERPQISQAEFAALNNSAPTITVDGDGVSDYDIGGK